MKLAKYLLSGAMVLGASSAHAIPAVGSFSGVQFASAVTTNNSGQPGTLGVGTTSVQFSNASGKQLISDAADPYNPYGPNNLLVANGGTVTVGDNFATSVTSFNIANGAVNFTVVVDSYTFTFTNELVTSHVLGNVGLYFTGNLTADADGGRIDTPSAASFSVTYTQSAPNGSIGAAYAINTPPAPPPPTVPEPATLSLLAAGLAALGARRRRSA